MRVAERGGEDSVRAPLRSYRERSCALTESVLAFLPRAQRRSRYVLSSPPIRVLYAGGVGRIGLLGVLGVIGVIGLIGLISLISLIKGADASVISPVGV